MKPAAFDYYAPSSIEEACRLLSEAGGGATVLAGGQTLMPLLALRMSQPFILVDITRIAELRIVTRGEGCTRIGPTLRQNELITHPEIGRALPLLVTAVRHVGHHQTRNRGTVGGSIALGEPAAELPATALALGASVALRSVRGTRRVALQDFYFGPYATALEPDELLVGIECPDWPAGTSWLFREIAQRPGDFALAGLSGAITVQDGRISRAGLAWFGMGPTPIRARQAEAALLNLRPALIDAQAIADLAIADTAPFDDHHASAEYRRTVGRRLCAKLLSETLQQRQAA